MRGPTWQERLKEERGNANALECPTSCGGGSGKFSDTDNIKFDVDEASPSDEAVPPKNELLAPNDRGAARDVGRRFEFRLRTDFLGASSSFKERCAVMNEDLCPDGCGSA